MNSWWVNPDASMPQIQLPHVGCFPKWRAMWRSLLMWHQSAVCVSACQQLHHWETIKLPAQGPTAPTHTQLWQLWSGSPVPRPIELLWYQHFWSGTARSIVLKYWWCSIIVLCESSSHHHGSHHHGSCHHGNIIETHGGSRSLVSYRIFSWGV